MRLQLLDKLMADKCMTIFSFTEKSRNDLVIAITVPLNIDDPLDIFVHKNRHLVDEWNLWRRQRRFANARSFDNTFFEILELVSLEKLCQHVQDMKDTV